MNRILIAACAVLGGLVLALPTAATRERLAAPVVFGLDKRLPCTTSRVSGSPDPPPPYRTRRAFERLAFRSPLYLTSDATHPGVFVVEQAGRIVYFKAADDRTHLFCELKDHDFYAMTFHPKYRANGFVYVFANGPNSKAKKKNRILRFRAAGDPPRCDPKSQQLVIEWESNGHNGGDLVFGLDGMLYVTSGDGTSDSDGDNTGQDLRDLCSGVLRLDVDRAPPGKGHAVPPDNPFSKVKGARPELYAFGLRNPWRMSIDRPTGDVYVADVGQDLWEMIYLLKRGANYGWSTFEGSHPFYPQRKLGPAPVVKPLVEHPHSEARSITGGHVYRGKRFKALVGAYVYGDYATGKVWGLRQVEGKIAWQKELASTRLQIVAFGADRDGELYLVDYGGQIHQFEPSPPPAEPSTFPRKLSESGLFASVPEHRPAPGVVPYDVNSPLWSDGSHKVRFFAIPGLGRVPFVEQGAWTFPEGTVLIKTFALDLEAGNASTRRRIETRFLTFQQGEWHGYSYAWDDKGLDGHLVEAGGRDRELLIKDAKAPGGTRKQTWHFPSRAECMVCHSRAANYVLGLTTAQMNRDFDYGGGTVLNQLTALEKLGLFRVPLANHSRALEGIFSTPRHLARVALRQTVPRPLRNASVDPLEKKARQRFDRWSQKLTNDLQKREATSLACLPEDLPRLASPYDRKVEVGARARSYLQSNCAHCHVWAGGGNSAIDLHVNTPLVKMKLVGERPLHDRFGIADALLVAPGAPERSILYHRVATQGRGRMPPLSSSVVDEQAAALLRDWVRGMKPAPGVKK